jgi:FkbM family methyltransferase
MKTNFIKTKTAVEIIDQIGKDLVKDNFNSSIPDKKDGVNLTSQIGSYYSGWNLNRNIETQQILSRLKSFYTIYSHEKNIYLKIKDFSYRIVLFLIYPIIKPLIDELATLTVKLNLTYANWLCSLSDYSEKLIAESDQAKENYTKLDGSIHLIKGELSALEKKLDVLIDMQSKLTATITKNDINTKKTLNHLRSDISSLEQETESRISCNLLATSIDTKALNIAKTKEGLFMAIQGDRISDTLLKGTTWDQHILDFIDKHPFKKRMLAIDVGANIGSLTIPFAKRFEKIIAFEPNAYAMNILKTTCFMNSINNVTFRHECVWSTFGKADIAPLAQQDECSLESDGSFSSRNNVNLGATSYRETNNEHDIIKMIPLKSLELAAVDFIKIDAQGADGRVLIGALPLLEKHKPVIVFEWEENLAEFYNLSFTEVSTSLEKIGYKIRVLKKHNSKQVDYVAISS